MKNQAYEPKKDLLGKIYTLYDETIKTSDFVCKEKCSSCCTCNVTMTSLEANYLFHSLNSREQAGLSLKIKNNFPQKRYIPKMTTNMFAKMCMEGKELPEEENDPLWGKCSLLDDDSCSVYKARPFGCRALLSRMHCKEKGYASLPPLVLTINNLFLQYIEHIDENGLFGNLSDIMTWFVSSQSIQEGKKDFLYNHKMPVLMVPPEHQEKVKPLLEKFNFLLQ